MALARVHEPASVCIHKSANKMIFVPVQTRTTPPPHRGTTLGDDIGPVRDAAQTRPTTATTVELRDAARTT